MSDSKEQEQELQAQERGLTFRRAINNAYAAVKGREAVQSFAAFSFEDALEQQLQRIEGGRTSTRATELERVQKVLNNMTNVVTQIKALPPDAFLESDPNHDVNSPSG